MIFYISDLHFGHQNAIRFDKRPFASVEEMDQTIIQNWNNTVKPEDTVYILGDMVWAKAKGWPGYLRQLNGHKILIKGNHDPNGFDKETMALLDGVYDYLEITDEGRHVVLSHYPIPMHKSAYNPNVYMLYGHVHTTREYHFIQELRKEIRDTALEAAHHNRGQWYNVGCMLPHINYTPRTLNEILAADTEEENHRELKEYVSKDSVDAIASMLQSGTVDPETAAQMLRDIKTRKISNMS